jgi:hypothetical protein
MDDMPAGNLRNDIPDFFPWDLLAPLAGDRAVGKYLWPRRKFVEPYETRASACTVIVRSIRVGTLEVALTAGFGLCADTPPEFGEYLTVMPNALQDRAWEYGKQVAASFNSVICLLALDGCWCEPITANELGPARHSSGRAHAFRVYPTEVNVPAEYETGGWGLWEGVNLEAFIARPLEDDLGKLQAISPECPYFVASAYHAAMRLKYRQALFDSFVVVEQYIEALWRAQQPQLESLGLTNLENWKKYTISRKCSVLHEHNLLDPALSAVLQPAILARNALLHQAQTTLEQASVSLTTLQRILELVLGRPVAPLWFPQGRSW